MCCREIYGYPVIPEDPGSKPEKPLAFVYNNFVTQRTNAKWLDDLEGDGERRSQALEDLSAMILHGLTVALRGKISPASPNFRALADKVAQQTLMYAQEHLSDYNGKSAFTTWVYKLAVRQALLDLRLQQWQAASPASALPDIHPAMYNQLVQNESLLRFHQIMKEELTNNQQVAVRSMVMFRVPKEEVARHLGLELCDYFGMIHDARLRMKKRLQADGWLPLE